MRPTLQEIDSVPPAEMSALPWLGLARAWVVGAGNVQMSHELLSAIKEVL
jgi:hypothetical protein